MAGTAEHDRTSGILARFQKPMEGIVLRASDLDLRAFEILDAERIAAELRPTALGLLREARAVLGEVQDTCDAIGEGFGPADTGRSIRSSYLPFERAIDETMPSRVRSHRTVEEIAFIALLELRQREERLERVGPEQGTAPLLGECDSSLRRIRKALSAVDAAIANVAGVPPLLVFTSEVEVSLAVRRAYAKFRARLHALGDPTPADLHVRFRAVGTMIAVLVGWNVYREMRVHDRLVLRDLQRRILDWLRDTPTETRGDGLRLWQDLTACVEMFSLVNRRQELVEHDGAVVRDSLLRLRKAAAVDDQTCAQLESLDGLDQELDDLLAERPRPSVSRIVGVLERLTYQFGPVLTPPPGKGGCW